MTDENDLELKVKGSSYSRDDRAKMLRVIKADVAWSALSSIADAKRELDRWLEDYAGESSHNECIDRFERFRVIVSDELIDSGLEEVWY